MNAEEAKQLGMDLVKVKGGAMLSKLSGTDILIIHTLSHKCASGRVYRVYMLAQMKGGLVTTVPTSVDEAKKIGEDLIKKKGGEMLSKVSGTGV